MDIAKEPGTEKRGGRAGRVLGVIGTILLIGVVTALIFVCIFAFYVKTCITPSLDIDLNDFTLNQSSIILCVHCVNLKVIWTLKQPLFYIHANKTVGTRYQNSFHIFFKSLSI